MRKTKKWQKIIAAIVLVAFLFQAGPVYALDQLTADLSELPTVTEIEENVNETTEEDVSYEDTENESETTSVSESRKNAPIYQISDVLSDSEEVMNGNGFQNKTKEISEIVGELEDLREPSVKYFLKKDNTITACTYDCEVHYETADGNFEDIDNTLTDSVDNELNDVVVNTDNAFSVKFAKKAKENKLAKMELGNGTISWGLEGANKKSELITDYTGKDLNYSLFNENDDPRVLETVTSYAKYPNIQNNTDLEYVINGSDIKENIILNSSDAPESFSFLYTTKGLRLTETEKGIEIIDIDGNVISHMNPLMMSDSELGISNDISVNLEVIKENQNHCEYRITIIPSAEWLNDPSRVYPVTIDPTISTAQNSTEVRANFVSIGSSGVQHYNDYFQVGTNGSSNQYMALIRPLIPSVITKNVRVVDAEFSALARSEGVEHFTSMANRNPKPVIEAHEITQLWDENTILWNEVMTGANGNPIFKEEMIDYEKPCDEDGVLAKNRVYTWDITKTMLRWTKDSAYYGILLKMPNGYTGTNSIARFYTSTYGTVSKRPVFTFTFLSMIGLEDYWTYHSQDAGLAGSGYINDFTGSLTASFDDVSLSSEKMPFAISHVYNGYNAHKIKPTLDVGSGWQLSVQESMEPVTIGGSTMYKYTDGDGTEHYFENQNGTWKDDSGLNYTLTIETDRYTITDKKDNKRLFARSQTVNNITPLTKIEDNHGNAISMNFNGSHQLRSVTDASGRTVTFNADSANRLQSMSLPDGKVIYYNYSDNTVDNTTFHKLVQVKFPGKSEVSNGTNSGNDNIAMYSYTESNTLTDMCDVNKGLSIHYDQEWECGARRVAGYCIRSGNNQIGSYYSVDYHDYITTFYEKSTPSTDDTGASRKETYTFNMMGQTTSAVDQDGNAIFTESGIAGGAKNKVTFASKTQRYTKNYIKNHNCETTGNYTATSALSSGTANKNIVLKTGSSEPTFNGTGCIKAFMNTGTDADDIYMYQTITVPGGDFYTFSTYVRTDYGSSSGENGAYIKISCPSGTVSKTGIVSKNAYTRHQVTIDLSSKGSTTLKVYVGVKKGYGLTYFDCLQLEKGSSANPYNLIENSDFDAGNYSGWTGVGLVNNYDGVETHTKHSDNYGFQFHGDPNVKKQLYTTINATVKSGEGIVYGAWIKSGALPNKDIDGTGNKQGIGMTVELSNGSKTQYGNLMITPSGRDWIYIAGKMKADADYNTVKVYLKCNYNANYTYFDDVTIFKDSFGESFEYDDNGNLESVVDLAKNTSNIASNPNSDITSYTDGMGNKYTMTYNTASPKKHELTSCTAPDNTRTAMEYDTFGNLTKLSVFSSAGGDKVIRTDTEYSNNGTYISATFDQRENKTTYNYQLNNGLLHSVSDPNSTTAKTEYTYDEGANGTDKLTKVKHNAMSNSVSYSYSNERLTNVLVGAMPYNYTYDTLGNLLSVSAGTGNTLLESYHYNDRVLMDQVSYGNGQTVNYTYDNQDRVKSIISDGIKTVDYDYNSNGLLGNAIYYSEGDAVSNQYQYDFAERYTSSYNSKGFGTDTITYDQNNNNTGYRAFLKRSGVDLSYRTAYTYNAVNELKSMSVTGGATQNNIYDGYGRFQYNRVKTDNGSTDFLTSCVYLDKSGTRTTNLVDKYNVRYSGETGNPDYSYKYTYDSSGNITKSVKTLKDSTTQEVRYAYDKLNQLTAISNYGNLGLKDIYSFDDRGNITRKNCYLCANNILQNYAQYEYDTTSLDQLIKYSVYNANNVLSWERVYTYDGAGNPIGIADSKNGNFTLEWTQGKKLSKYENTSSGIRNTYCYNESGLVSKLTKANGSTVEYYYDDGQLEYEEYRNSSGSLTRIHKYFYDAEGNVKYLLTKTKSFSNIDNYNLYAYVYDGMGTITDLVRLRKEGTSSSSAAVGLAVHYEYDAYGKILSATNHISSGENISQFNPIKYKGYYYEDNIGLYRPDSRFYDPVIARFLNADDLSLITETPTSLSDKNLYNYCDNNPVMRKDDDGEFWFVAAAAVGAAVGGGLEIVNQLVTEGKVTNWGAVAVNAASGAITGALPATGYFRLASAIINCGTDLVTSKMKGESVSFKSAGLTAGLSVIGGKKIDTLMESTKYTRTSISQFGKKLNQSKVGQWYKTSKVGRTASRINRRLKCGRGSASQAYLSGLFGWKTKLGYSYYRSRKGH